MIECNNEHKYHSVPQNDQKMKKKKTLMAVETPASLMSWKITTF